MRTIVDLPDEQLRALKLYCQRKGISRAEAVRRAVATLVKADADEQERKQAAIKAAFGIWKDRRDAQEILDELRAEWDRPL